MNQELLETTIELPAGVTVQTLNGVYTVKGPKGELVRRLFHPRITGSVSSEGVTLSAKNATKREKKMIYTYQSHIKNMVFGVTEGHEYKLKICSGHFPMTVALKGDMFEVKNFIGEAVPRTLRIEKDVKVEIDGVVITVTGNDVECTSRVAARIEMLCRRSGFDRRIFQDGIYITHKDGKQV